MKQGFVKAAAATPKVVVADCAENTDRILESIQNMREAGAKIMVLPELAITGYTCSDLFWQERLLREADHQLMRLMKETTGVGRPDLRGSSHGNFRKAVQCGGGFKPGESFWGWYPRSIFPAIMNSTRDGIFAAGSEQAVWIEKNRRKGSLRHESALCLPGNAASDRRGGDLRGSVGAESSQRPPRSGRSYGSGESFRQR